MSPDETWEGCYCIAETRKMVGEVDTMEEMQMLSSKDKMSNVVCKNKLDQRRIRHWIMGREDLIKHMEEIRKKKTLK